MKEDQDLKLTELDYLIGDNHLQMMKAALPYVNVANQRMLSLYVKMNELRRTASLFQNQEVAAMGINSGNNQKSTPWDMLEAIKPFANTYEQSFIELIGSMMQTVRNTRNNSGNNFMGQNSAMEQFKHFMSPEQQSRLETMQFLLQTMQQIT